MNSANLSAHLFGFTSSFTKKLLELHHALWYISLVESRCLFRFNISKVLVRYSVDNVVSSDDFVDDLALTLPEI